MKKYLFLIYICITAVSILGCEKAIDENIKPSNDKTDIELLKTLYGLATATNGSYSLLVTQNAGDFPYDLTWFHMSEFKGNNLIAVTQARPNYKDDGYTYENSPTLGITPSFWKMSYRIIFSANKVIDAIPDGKGPDYDQLKGENYFLRAMVYFNMARIYGRPYYQNNETALAVPLSLSSDMDNNYKPARNTVKEVYAQVISDLEKSASLMTKNKTNNYASKESAWALLSRVYLYMSGTATQPNLTYCDKAIEYANKVIASPRFALAQYPNYVNAFAKDSKTNNEFIFAFNHDASNRNQINDFLVPKIFYVIYYENGQYAASPDYIAILNQNPADLRRSFVIADQDPRITLQDKSRYTITKYNFGVDPNANSAQSNSGTCYLRLAEMYLNKAEALAKKGLNSDALVPLNEIRKRAKVPEWTIASLTGAQMTVFQATLMERRLELAYEGHGTYDDFRNGLPMKRFYADYFHNTPFTVEASDKRVVYPIPFGEILLNGNLAQNPL